MAASEDDALRALCELAEALDTAGDELDGLASRCRDLAAHRELGDSWSSVVANEARPLIVEELTRVQRCVEVATARFRRAQAQSLSAEGLTHDRIADLFGVTRQRVGALLAASEPKRREPKQSRSSRA